jgi:hypothetical protein
MANHFVYGTEAKLCHDGSQFISDIIETAQEGLAIAHHVSFREGTIEFLGKGNIQVNDMLRCALELCAELGVLSCNSNRAGVQLNYKSVWAIAEGGLRSVRGIFSS